VDGRGQYFYQAGPLPGERAEARKKAEEVNPKALCATHPKYGARRKPTGTCSSCWKAWQLKLANKTWNEMSTRERILERFNTGDGKAFTAAQVAKYAAKKLSTVSSELHSLFKEGLVLRVDGFGERGGYGYLMNPNRRDDCLRLLGKIPFDVKVYNK
jgi:hypothetical protein